MSDFLSPMIEIAQKAGRILASRIGKIKGIQRKDKSWSNLVTEADQKSEKFIVERWLHYFPDHWILGEEKGWHPGTSGFKLIVDPLDGTTNFAHGLPYFCVSLGLEHEEMPVAGVVYAPLFNELFYAQNSKHAFLNGKKIRVSKVETLKKSLVMTGFAYNMSETVDNNIRHFVDFMRHAQAVRRAGSAALDICYVACGRLDGFWQIGLFPWDISGARVIVEQAGGMVSDFSGKPYSHGHPQILCSNGMIHQQMLRVLKQPSVGR